MIIREGKVIPNVGIGPFRLGMSTKELEKIICDYTIENRTNGILKVYHVENAQFFFDKNDALQQAGVSFGFKSKYLDAIGIGDTVKELTKLGYEYYEEFDDYLIRGVDGICFELGDTNSDDDWNEKEAPIEWIFVYDKKADEN